MTSPKLLRNAAALAAGALAVLLAACSSAPTPEASGDTSQALACGAGSVATCDGDTSDDWDLLKKPKTPLHCHCVASAPGASSVVDAGAADAAPVCKWRDTCSPGTVPTPPSFTAAGCIAYGFINESNVWACPPGTPAPTLPDGGVGITGDPTENIPHGTVTPDFCSPCMVPTPPVGWTVFPDYDTDPNPNGHGNGCRGPCIWGAGP